MKKSICTILVFTLLCAACLPIISFAETGNGTGETMWRDITLSDEEFELVLSQGSSVSGEENSVMASGLITNYSIGISKSGSTLTIAGRTQCVTDVVKCGFSKVTIQRRANSSSSWSNYQTYTSLYVDGYKYTLSKSLTVASGYQYRVTCTHYAKKSLLSTQKINNTSNTVTV